MNHALKTIYLFIDLILAKCHPVHSAKGGFLSVEALKAAAHLLAPCVAALSNALALVGCLPPSRAVSTIIPISKSGDTGMPGTYRGIAVCTVLSKLLQSS